MTLFVLLGAGSNSPRSRKVSTTFPRFVVLLQALRLVLMVFEYSYYDIAIEAPPIVV